MTEDEFVGLVGPTLVHVTAASNLASICAMGLMRPATLAARAGVDPRTLALRREAVTLALPGGSATLNHQLPLWAGRGADFIDGMTLREWAAHLDERLFFWPGRPDAAFAGSVEARGATGTLAFDARAMFRAYAPHLDLAPINTGSATRRPAPRGTWVYVPATATVAAFRDARRARGLKAGPDAVREVSLRCDVPPEALPALMLEEPARASASTWGGTPPVCRTVAEMRAARAPWDRVALVPTMGALHAGHRALVDRAKGLAERVVVSIFVNPSQFGDPADLATYPRTFDADMALLRDVDAVFMPTAAAMYGPGDETVVETTRLAGAFHGAVRPGHFRGVATVVCKLLGIVRPDVALFGEKDYQQLAVVRRMVRDLFLGVEIVGVPTVRAADGLALSSRNARLGAEDRVAAAVLSRALDAAQAMAQAGGTVEALTRAIRATIAAEPRSRLAGVDVVDAATFEPVTGALPARAGIMLSAEVGGVLLIDQREVP